MSNEINSRPPGFAQSVIDGLMRGSASGNDSLTARATATATAFLPVVSTPAALAEYQQQYRDSIERGGIGNWALTGVAAVGVVGSLIPGAGLVRGTVRLGVREGGLAAREGAEALRAPTGARSATRAGPEAAAAADRAAVATVRSTSGVTPVLQNAMQRAADAGPNRWIATGTRGAEGGTIVQRGLSGNYAAQGDGAGEAVRTFGGTETTPRWVSIVGDTGQTDRVTAQTTRQYTNPIAVQARVEPGAVAAGVSGDARVMSRPLAPNDITRVNFMTPQATDRASNWLASYRSMLEQTGLTPRPGSRGARFLRDAEATVERVARYEVDYVGRSLTNPDEVDRALIETFRRYGGS